MQFYDIGFVENSLITHETLGGIGTAMLYIEVRKYDNFNMS